MKYVLLLLISVQALALSPPGSPWIWGPNSSARLLPSGGANFNGYNLFNVNEAGIGTSSPGANLEIDMTAIGTIGQIIKGISSQTADYFDIKDSTGTNVLNFTKFGLLGVNKISPAAMIEADSNGTSQQIIIIKGIAGQTADALDIENSTNTKLDSFSGIGDVGFMAAAAAGTTLSLNYPATVASAATEMSLSQATYVAPATATAITNSTSTDTTAYAASGNMFAYNSTLINSKPATGNSASVHLNGIIQATQSSTTINTASTTQSYFNSSGGFQTLEANTVSGSTTGASLTNTAVTAAVVDELQHSSSGTNTETNIGVSAGVGDFLTSHSNGTVNRTDYGVKSSISALTGAHTNSIGYAVWASAAVGTYNTQYDFYAASGSPSYFTGDVQLKHIVGNTTITTPTPGAGAGTGASVFTDGHSGDISGEILVTTGVLPSASSVIFTLTFSSAYTAGTHVSITPANSDTATLSSTQAVYPSGSTTNFTLNSNTVPLAAATTYIWYYRVDQ